VEAEDAKVAEKSSEQAFMCSLSSSKITEFRFDITQVGHSCVYFIRSTSALI
jgi:hypothetical protein